MKTLKKILIIVCILITIAGMFILGRNGLNFSEEYTKETVIEVAKQYIIYIAISTIIVLLYFSIRYFKQGLIKVLTTAILGILGALALVIAVIAIIRMPIENLFFPIMLSTYVASIIILSANFEENT